LPSSRHLGLYKALANTAYCNNSGEFSKPFDVANLSDSPTNEKAEQILQVIHGLAMTAATSGFYL
jgi:hypothetical protein